MDPVALPPVWTYTQIWYVRRTELRELNYSGKALAICPGVSAGASGSAGVAAPSGGAPKPGPRARRAQPASPKRKGTARFQQLDINAHSGAGEKRRPHPRQLKFVTFALARTVVGPPYHKRLACRSCCLILLPCHNGLRSHAMM